jgi:uncharacterized membrane protein YhaH (DUF805 family)
MLNNIYKLLFDKLFTLKGRSSRKEYICRVFFLVILIVIDFYTFDTYGKKDSFFSFVYVILLAILIILMFLQYFPLAIRRLHDLNSSGWYVLLTFAPFGQLLILWLMFKKGTPTTNKYGEPPIN